MIKKLILITILSLQLAMGGFIMTKGQPLVKTEDSPAVDTNPAPTTSHTELSSTGCTDNYATTVTVNSASTLASAVRNANTPTKIVLANGNYNSNMILNGNSTNICIEAENQNQAIVTNKIEILSNNIILSNIKFTGVKASIYASGNDIRITKCTFDNAGKPYNIRTMGSLRFEIDHTTFKNFHHIQGEGNEMLIIMHTYADDIEPAAAKIHHNYFKDITTDKNGEFATMQLRLRRSHTQQVGLGEHPSAYHEEDNGWNYGRDEWKMDDSIISYNYFDNCTDPVNTKINGLTFAYNTIRKSNGKMNLRAGKKSTITHNYIFGNGTFEGFNIIDRNHTITSNYIENTKYPMGGITIMNGGVLVANKNKYEPAENIEVHNNYLKDMKRGIYFGLKIDSTGNPDLPPSGNVTNNIFVNTDTPIHINTYGEPLMQNITTTSNTVRNTVWDMSGAYSSTDVTSGIIGSGKL